MTGITDPNGADGEGGPTGGIDGGGTAPDAGPTAADPAPADPALADPALAGLTYEQARTELASVVERLEAGGCTLEQALELWERGEALAQVCQQRLEGARARLTGP